MRSSKSIPGSISTLIIAALTSLAPAAAQQQLPQQEQEALPADLVEAPNDQEHATVDNPDGTRLIGGHLGTIPDTCSAGPRAFVEKRDDLGAVLWKREQGGASRLFQGALRFDADRVTSSSVYDLATDPATGNVVVAGQTTLQASGGSASIAAFVLILDGTDGSLIADQLLGIEPTGTPPSGGCCSELCDEGGGGGGGGGGGEWCTAHGIAVAPGTGIAVTGSCDPRDPTLDQGQDLFLAFFEDDLSVEKWRYEIDRAGDDGGRDVAIDPVAGLIAVGGFYEQNGPDAFAATFDLQGNLLDVFVGGGDFQDVGETVTFDASGDIVLSGTFTEAGTFGGEDLGGPGQCQQGFQTTLDPQTLEVKSAEEIDPQGVGTTLFTVFEDPAGSPSLWASKRLSAPSEPQPALPPNPLVLTDYTLLIGYWQTGCIEDLMSSDDLYLNIQEGLDQAGNSVIELLFHFDLDPGVEPADFTPQALNLELKADTCYTATVWLDGLVDDVLHEVGSMQVCPGTEPVITAPISDELALLLGFGPGAAASQPGAQLDAKLRIDFGPDCPAPPGAMCTSPAEDSSVDEISVDTGL